MEILFNIVAIVFGVAAIVLSIKTSIDIREIESDD